MLLVSKFRDYYDKIKAFGIDKTVVYKRETVDIPRKRKSVQSWRERDEFPGPDERQNQKSKYVFTYAVIGFCGSLHPVIQALRYGISSPEVLLNKTNFYSYDEITDFLSQRNLKEKPFSYFRQTDIDIGSLPSLKRFFDHNTWTKFSGKFREHSIPTFAYTTMKTDPGFMNEGLKLNPRLEDYDFGKIKDAVSAFQSIYMYLSGVLGTPERPMVKLSDKDLAKKRGHGDKYSFRKPPTKNAKRKNKKNS